MNLFYAIGRSPKIFYSSQPVAEQRCLRFRLTFESVLQVVALEMHSNCPFVTPPLLPSTPPIGFHASQFMNLPIKLCVQRRPRVGRHIKIDGKNLFFHIFPSAVKPSDKDGDNYSSQSAGPAFEMCTTRTGPAPDDAKEICSPSSQESNHNPTLSSFFLPYHLGSTLVSFTIENYVAVEENHTLSVLLARLTSP